MPLPSLRLCQPCQSLPLGRCWPVARWLCSLSCAARKVLTLDAGVNHVSLPGMETVTIRELRQNWPAVEKRLAAAGELTVTRDGTPVAELTPPRRPATKKTPARFDPEAHQRLLKKIWGAKPPTFSFSA